MTCRLRRHCHLGAPLHLLLKISVLLNLLVAMVNGAVTLVLLLIAPLGLATVITCTVLVTLVSFALGVVADVLLWRLLPADQAIGHGRAATTDQRLAGDRGRPAIGSGAARLTQRRGR